jgi:PST family polysaccharide transporter
MSDQSRHFDTEHLRKDLRGRSVRGGLVTVGSQGIKFALTLVSTAVLARLLTPDDFGLVAMVAAIVGFATLFKDLGLSMATVQRENITHSQVSTLFWINVGVSTALALLVAALSPLVALLYGDERLIAITVALGATFIFGGFTSQHTALLRRQMRFSALATIEVVAYLIAIIAAITIATLTRSYWALVAMMAIQALVTMFLAWALSGWMPGKPGWDHDVRGMLSFGGHLTGFNALNYFTRNFDNVLIGVAYGPGPLGLYSRAYNLLLLPIRQINGPVTSVAMPALCRLQNDPVAYRRFFLRTVSLLSLVTAPLVAYTFADADLLVLALLGEQWTDATPIFRWLAPAALIGAINIVPGWLCSSLGRTQVQMKWAMWSAPVVVTGFVIGLPWGPEGVAASFSITFTATFLVFIAMACRESPVAVGDIWMALRRTFLSAVLASLLLLLLKSFAPIEHLPLLMRFSVSVPAFGIFFVAALGSTRLGRDEMRRLVELRHGLQTRV